ncbi:DUF6494 family protein [Fulvimarina sp. MAC3]|uniref:DUF6494 family protein n=1 Tax=Fulvimarina sp. MAC3 TaxID=3148887 RepID=UPI0031FE116C
MSEENFNMSLRKFLKQVGVTSQREIEELVRSGGIENGPLKVRVTLTAENADLKHVVEGDIQLP